MGRWLLCLLGLTCSVIAMDSTTNPEAVSNFDDLWDYAKPAETRKRFSSWLQHRPTLDTDTRLQLQTQIARTHSLVAEFAQAHELLDQVLAELSAQTPQARVRYHLERGRTFNSAGDTLLAREQFLQAYRLTEDKAHDTYRIDAAHMMAIVETDLDEKLQWNNRGLEAARQTDDPAARKWIGVFHNNKGWDLFEAKRYEDALVEFEQCRVFHQQQGNRANLDIARWSIAKTYRYLGRIEEALAIQQALLAQSGGEDDSGYTYEELAELYLSMGEKARAGHFFKRAYAILSTDTWLQRNERERLERLKLLAESLPVQSQGKN